MRKQTLASLATLLITATSASANPWATYDWSSNSWAAQATQPVAYPQAQPAQQQPVASFQQFAPVGYDEPTGEATPVGYTAMPPATACPNCPTGVTPSQRYAAPQAYPAPPVQQPMYDPGPVMEMTAPAYGGEIYGAPVYGAGAAYSSYGTACAVPSRGWHIDVFAEALFLQREDNFDDLRNFTDGPNDSGFGFGDVLGGGDATGWRIGADLLFGDPCSDWEHGVGFTYFDPGTFGSAATGTFDLGIAFDAGTKGTDPSALAGCYVLSQNTFFASMARVASVNTLTNNEQDEFEGLGPDPSTVAFDPGRTTGSEAFALPTWEAGYRSHIDGVGVNFLVSRKRGRRLKMGLGWQQYNVNENSFVAIRGPLHATDATFFTAGFPQPDALLNNGLEHSSFLDDTRNDGSDPGLEYVGPPGSEDGFDAQNTGTAGLTDGSGPDVIELLSTQQADNTLNGVNFFITDQLFRHGGFDMTARLNAGVYHNDARATVTERYSELTSNGSAYGRTFTESQDVVSFVGTVALDAGYWVTDSLRFYGGYEVIFISGVALSPEQESGIVGNQFDLQHDGDLILHGAKVGFEFIY